VVDLLATALRVSVTYPRREAPGLWMTIMPNQALPRVDSEVRANLACTLCARTAGTVRGPDARSLTLASVQAVDVSHVDANPAPSLLALLGAPVASGP
jgi:hypothetical protein